MNKHGEYIWYELMTDNADAAQRFYTEILGWQVRDSGQAEESSQEKLDYRICSATDPDTGETHDICGLMQLTQEMQDCGARPSWLGYIGVDDVDQSVSRILAAGGYELMPATDIPHVGRLAMLTDPQGVPFYLMRGESDQQSKAFADDRPRLGHCAWNELTALDPEEAKAFYFQEFGWTKDGEMPMGELGDYEFIRHNGLIGAVMPKPEDMPTPMWSYYFRVADIDLAADKIVSGGGQLLHGPDEIPGGDYVLKALDPQGALLALIGARTTEES